MTKGIMATAEITINEPIEKVWQALTDPGLVKQYFFGTNMEADWKVGGKISYRGEWEGKPYEDKGEVLEIDPPNKLVTDYYSALSGKPDVPENHQTVSYLLSETDKVTTLTITQDGNADQAAADHNASNWMMVLKGMKELLEK